MRNTEPGPYNGVGSFLDFCPGNRQESGIRFNQALTPILGGLTCLTAPDAAQWNVRGDLFSNSRIVVDPASSGPVMIAPPTGTTGTIKARGGCTGTGFTCTDVGWNFADGLGQDPGITNPADYAPASLSGLTVQSVPSASECSTGNGVVEFSPGIYTDGTALNALFGDPACKNATFWFQPGSGTQTGVYYFDFRNSSVPGYACGTDINFFAPPTGNLSHAWCIGGRASDYSGQRVIGGTPFAWSPTADPTSHQVTLEPAANAGNGTGFFGFLQQTGFTNPANAKSINGTTADMAMTAGRPGSSIWLSGYPEVPRGGYGLGLDLELAQSGANVTRMNAPTVQVNYGALLSGGTCGPYTLPKPPADGSLATIKLSTVNPAAAADLAACLNSGDRINTAVVQYNVGRPWFQGSPYPTARLDGARFTLTAKDQPDFPRLPTATDPGGDCDAKKPGVQFIFGGDSHVYVANGGMELCAGPNSADPANGKEIAVYGVPAAPRLVPVSVSGTSASDGVTNPDNALRIAEGAGLAAADIKYRNPAVGASSQEGTETLRFSGYTPPAGYTIGKVELRASYKNATSCFLGALGCVAPQYDLVGFPGGCGAAQAMPAGSAMQAQSVDVTSCMTAANRIASTFDVRWHARSSCFISCSVATDQLDGIELMVTLVPTNPDTTLRPAYGCITSSPNYWYGTNSPECALLKVDAPFASVVSTRRGRMSIKGTVYAPSAVIDVDDGDVYYPIFGRGLIARHFRLKGFGYHPGYSAPIVGQLPRHDGGRPAAWCSSRARRTPAPACPTTRPSRVGRRPRSTRRPTRRRSSGGRSPSGSRRKYALGERDLRACRGQRGRRVLDLLGVHGAVDRVLVGDHALLDELVERHLHRLHALAHVRRDHVADLVGLALADQVPDRVVRGDHLERGHETAADARDQTLADDARERCRELDADLLLPLAGEHVDDAVEGGHGVVGVQRGEHEVSGLGDGQRELDRLGVSHLTDEDDVGVFTQRGAKCPLERVGVEPDLALVDRGPLVAVHVLDRVFDREDVALAIRVDVVDHRRLGRRLPGTGRAGDEEEALRQVREAAR